VIISFFNRSADIINGKKEAIADEEIESMNLHHKGLTNEQISRQTVADFEA